MKVSFSKEKTGVIGIAGHVGCGHCHSHSQFLQDDSCGLATVLTLFQEATSISLAIKDVYVTTGRQGFIEVETASGGIGKALARRGITQQEARLAKSVIGREAVRTQALALEAFGRIYGQGVHETAVALQTAIANATLDSFARNFPDKFIVGEEDVEGSSGRIIGTILDFDDVPVAVLATVNASTGGIGPNEDLEGNVAAGRKGEMMAQLGMIDVPTIVVESKIFSPMFSKLVKRDTFLIRADNEADNPFVAKSLAVAAQDLNYPYLYRDDVMARAAGGLAAQTRALGEKIVELGVKLQSAEYSQEKINILAELAVLISQDGAGLSFMSNRLHEVVGSAGMMPGTGGVVNLVVPAQYLDDFLFPYMTEEDVCRYTTLVKAAVKKLHQVLPEAVIHIEKKHYVGCLDHLVMKEAIK